MIKQDPIDYLASEPALHVWKAANFTEVSGIEVTSCRWELMDGGRLEYPVESRLRLVSLGLQARCDNHRWYRL